MRMQFLSKVFALEITKPSEQTFKVLLNPKQVGGVIMLFSQPVGRQEYDNLSFMRRFSLIPSEEEQYILDDMLKNKKYDSVLSTFGEKARNWRGVVLPKDGNLAARMILRYKYSGLFKNMCFYSKKISSKELSDKGVTNFWMFVDQEVRK